MKSLKLLLLLAYVTHVWASEEPTLGQEEDEDVEAEVDNGDEEEEVEEPAVYDPDDEPLDFPCRRDPTWKKVDFDQCQELSGWYPDDTWWKIDAKNNERFLGDNEARLGECLEKAFDDAKEKYDWAKYVYMQCHAASFALCRHRPAISFHCRLISISSSFHRCDENNKTEICAVETASAMGHYFREEQGAAPLSSSSGS